MGQKQKGGRGMDQQKTGAVCLAGTVLLAVSAALNVLALALRALDEE